MYERIRNQHARTASDNRLILLQQFSEYKFQPGHNVTSHVTALELLWARLTDIGEHIPETQVMSKILSTLPSSYRHFYTTWNNSPEAQRSVKLLLTKLQEEEAITQAFNKNNLNTDAAYFTPNYPQFPTSSNHYQQPNQEYNTPAPYQTYDRPHPYQPTRGGFQTGRGGYPGPRGGYRGFRGNFRGGFRGNTQPQELCPYCGLGPHKESNCRHKKRDEARRQQQQQSNANFSYVDQDSENVDYSYTSSDAVDFETFGFVADSGSSEHMTDKRSILINFKPIPKGTHSVRGIGGTSLEAEGKGDVEVINTAGKALLLKDVLYVPGLGVNLFSISAATSKGSEAIFYDDMVNFNQTVQL